MDIFPPLILLGRLLEVDLIIMLVCEMSFCESSTVRELACQQNVLSANCHVCKKLCPWIALSTNSPV